MTKDIKNIAKFLPYIYNDTLYNISTESKRQVVEHKHSKIVPWKNGSPNNKLLIVTGELSGLTLEDPQLTFLQKLLKSIHLIYEDVILINNDSINGIGVDDIAQILKIDRILIFSNSCVLKISTPTPSKYDLFEESIVRLLWVDELPTIVPNNLLKRKLWEQLQKFI